MKKRRMQKKQMLSGIRRSVSALLAFCCLFLCIFVMPAKEAPKASAAEIPGITFEEFSRFHTFKPSTLFVGTYVIEFKGLTGRNFQDALISREMYGQDNKYYKTELTRKNGTYESWRDIFDAGSLAVIMPGGRDIPKSSLKDLYITVYIDENGVPHDPAKEASRINPFLYPDPYDFEQLPEFEGLWSLIEKDPLVSGRRYQTGPISSLIRAFRPSYHVTLERVNSATDIMAVFFPEDRYEYNGITGGVHDSLTDLMDKGVNGLWDTYLSYVDADGSVDAYAKEKAKVLYDVMSQADATRRAEVFYYLTVNTGANAGGNLQGAILPKMRQEIQSELDARFAMPRDGIATMARIGNIAQAHTDVLKVLNEIKASGTASDTAYANYSALRLVRGRTAVSQYRFDLSVEMMEQAADAKKVDAIADSLIDLGNIEEDNPDRAAREYAMLDEILIPMQDENFSDYLTEGIPEGYPVSGDSQTSRAMLEAQKTSAQNAKLELESYVVKLISRSSDNAALLTALNRELTWISLQKSAIPRDEYASYAEAERYDYEQWLLAKIRAIESELDPEVLEPDTLEIADKIVELEEEMDRANRYDDPKKAKDIQAMIDALKKRLPTEPEYGGGDGLTPGEGQGDPYNGMYDGNGFPDGDDPSGANVDMAGSGNPEYTPRDLSGDDSGKDRDDGSNSGDPSGSGSNQGSGSSDAATTDRDTGGEDTQAEGMGHLLTSGELDEAIRRCIGDDITAVSDDAAAAMVCALNEFGRDYRDDKALEKARELLEIIMENGNVLVYTKYQLNPQTEYVSLGVVDKARRYTRYRCVRDELEITMTRLADGEAYVYQVGSTRMDKTDGSYEYLSAAVTLQTDSFLRTGSRKFAYLAEEDAQRKLGCRAEYIVQSPYAVCVTASMESTIAQFVRILKEVAGYIGS